MNQERKTMDRRTFVTRAAGSVAAAAVLPAVGRAADEKKPIRIALIGCGGRGNHHLRVIAGLKGAGEAVEIAAACDIYRPRAEATAKAHGVKWTMKRAEVLADPAIDAVCIATTDHTHGPIAIDAVRAGKDVYCEKPMGHWSQFELSKQFYEETRKLNRVVQIGNQGNSSLAWKKVNELVQKGAIGRVQHVQAGFYRYGDWGERMPIADPEAKPGPDLDWEAFLGDAPKVPFTVNRFFSWRKYLDYAGGPCTDLFPHVFTPFVSALGLKFPSLAVASGGIFKYTTYDREVPDTFNMCLDYPEKLSIVLVCTLTNEYHTEPAIRGDEGTLTLQNPADWTSGFDSVTLWPRKGAKQVIAGGRVDATSAHWQNFLSCVRTREKPVSDVEFGFHVQTALNMALLGYLNKKVAQFDLAKEEIVL